MKIVQAKLRSANNELLTTWLDFNSKLRRGAWISLKDYKPEVKWQVVEVYTSLLKEAGDFDFHRKWDNNNYDKHEGLLNGRK